MAITQALVTDFTAGELSPKMQGRYDLAMYNKGARELLNMVPFFPGGATKRPGFSYIGATKGSGRVRLKNFCLTQSFSYLLEFGAGYIRFWREGELIQIAGHPIEVATPWSVADLDHLQFAQDDRTLYIASGVCPVKILTMTTIDSFTFGDIALTAREGQVPFQGTGNYPRAIAFMDGRLYLASTDNEPCTIWASEPFDYGNFTYYDTVTSSAESLRNPLREMTATIQQGNATVYLDAATLAKLKVGDRISGEGILDKEALTFVGSVTKDSADITKVSSSIVADIESGEAISGNAIPSTTIVSAGGNTITIVGVATATNELATFTRPERRTYILSIAADHIVLTEPPRASKDNARIYAGWHDPTIPEYEVIPSSKDIYTASSAMKKTIASDQAERILWLAAGRELIVGTTSGQRIVPSGSTTISFKCHKQTAISAAAQQPFFLNEAVLFVESNRRAIQEYIYSSDDDGYKSNPVCPIADHILGTGTFAGEYQNSPMPIAWYVRDDGVLAGMAFSHAVGLQAWFRCAHGDGTIESIAVLSSEGDDILYAAVRRGATYGIEKLETVFASDVFLDSSAKRTVAAGQITGLDWLSGPVTVSWGDGLSAIVTAAAGAAPAPAGVADGTTVTVGIPYPSRIVLMPVAVNQMRLKTVPKIIAKVLDCYPFTAGYQAGTRERARWTGKQTGDREILISGSFDTDGSLCLEQNEPNQTTILALMVEVGA